MSEVSAGAVVIEYARPEPILSALGREPLLAVLSASERERHARFHFESDRDIYLVAHALVRGSLARAGLVAPEAFEFVASEHGRPEISAPDAARDLRFNLSHTRGLVACAVARGLEIGIDVEDTRRQVDILGVARHVFSAVEVAGLTELTGPARHRRFFELWTLKEAYIKAIGKGFSAPLRSITFLPQAADPVPIQFDSDVQDRAETWCMRRFPVGEAHRLALAIRAHPETSVVCRELEPDALLSR